MGRNEADGGSARRKGMPAGPVPDLPSGLSAETVQEQLERILATDSFLRAKRLSRFLRYVVEQALAGKSAEIKEYSVGLAVFDKPVSFDTRTDPIVRVEAGRLRAKILEYYDTVGVNQALWVGLRSRGYRPVFRNRDELVPEGWAASGTAAVPAVMARPAIAVRAEQPGTDAEAEHGVHSVVVLPFSDLSRGKTQEHFCDAITQEITNALARVPTLRVVSKTSASQFKGKAQDVREIAQELQVSAVLEGSVQSIGTQVRITAQLVDAQTGYDLWAETYDRSRDDVFRIQDEVSAAIASALGCMLSTEPDSEPKQEPRPVNLDSHKVYLKALRYAKEGTDGSLKKAIRNFQKALQKEPGSAVAQAGLASAHIALAVAGATAPREAMPQAMTAAAEALRIEPELAEARTALATVTALYDRDFYGAEQDFRLALHSERQLASLLQWYALSCLLPQGRLSEALGYLHEAHEMDPTSIIINTHLGLAYHFKRDYERAVNQLRLTIELDPQFYRAYWDLGRAYVEQGRFDEALESYHQARKLPGGSTFRLGALGYCYARMERTSDAREVIATLETAGKKQYVSPYNLAEIYLGLGDVDSALRSLHLAEEDRTPWLTWLNCDPTFDSVRRDQRFLEIEQKIGLCAPDESAFGVSA